MNNKIIITDKVIRINLKEGINTNEEIILPLSDDDYKDNDIKRAYEKMGIEIINEVKDCYGDLFATVKLPNGWGITTIDNYDGFYRVIDDKGKIKVTFFGRSYEDSSLIVSFNEGLL